MWSTSASRVLAALVLPVGTGAHVVALEDAALVSAQALAEARDVGQKPAIDHLGGEQRDQTDHRVDVDAVIPAVGRDDQVLEEAGIRIPQRHPAVGVAADGIGDGEELLESLNGDVLVVLVFDRQFERHHRHVQREHRHPSGGVRLLQAVARRQRLRPVDDRDVVEAEKAAFEDVLTVGILTVDPPGVIQQQLMKDPLQETAIALAALHPFRAEGLERAERVDRRIDIAEVPLVRRDLAVRVQITIAQHQLDLVLGEVDIDQRQGAAVKRQIPGGEPRIFPAVGHGDHVAGLEMLPLAIAPIAAAGRRREPVALEPHLDIVVEELLAPDHAGERLAHDPVIFGASLGQEFVEKDVCFALPRREHDLAACEGRRERMRRQYEIDANVLTGWDAELVPGGELGASALRVDRIVRAIDDEAMERVLDIGRRVRLPPQPLGIAFVFGEQQLGPLTAV